MLVCRLLNYLSRNQCDIKEKFGSTHSLVLHASLTCLAKHTDGHTDGQKRYLVQFYWMNFITLGHSVSSSELLVAVAAAVVLGLEITPTIL